MINYPHPYGNGRINRKKKYEKGIRMLSADHRRLLRPPNNMHAQGHYMTGEQCIHIVILILFLCNMASNVQNDWLPYTNLPTNLLPTNYFTARQT